MTSLSFEHFLAPSPIVTLFITDALVLSSQSCWSFPRKTLTLFMDDPLTKSHSDMIEDVNVEVSYSQDVQGRFDGSVSNDLCQLELKTKWFKNTVCFNDLGKLNLRILVLF
jgi:hypothetical protein